MVRTQIVIEESQRIAPNEIAQERGVSVSEVIRQMIGREVDRRELDRTRSAAEALRSTYLQDSGLSAFALREVEGLDDEG
jgi:hypothetical protein